MANKDIVRCPECNGRGAIQHRDAVRENFYRDWRPIYRPCVRCKGSGWIKKPGWLDEGLWSLFRGL